MPEQLKERRRSNGLTQRGVAEDPMTTAVVTRAEGRPPAPAAEHPDRLARDRAGRLRSRQANRFGGTNWGVAFFGVLVAIGIAVILTALLSAAGTATGLTDLDGAGGTKTISLAGGAVLTAIAALSYFAGGYVAARMARFDGPRQGAAAWAWGLILAVALAALGLIAGAQYNVLGSLDLPRIPVDEGTLTDTGAITLGAIVVASLAAAIAGGWAGEGFHRRVDEAAFRDGLTQRD
jgi:hypothetical protein